MKLIFLFLFSVFIFPNENEVYTLKTRYSSGEIVKYRTEFIMDFQFVKKKIVLYLKRATLVF